MPAFSSPTSLRRWRVQSASFVASGPSTPKPPWRRANPPIELFYDSADLDPDAPRLYVRRNGTAWRLDQDGVLLSVHASQGEAIGAAPEIAPDGEDWWFAGKVLNALYRGLRSHRRGPTPAIPKEEQQRLLRDVLIARSARRINASVVTYNAADFEKIRRFCNVRVVEPAEILN
jgi:hypothetical protein